MPCLPRYSLQPLSLPQLSQCHPKASLLQDILQEQPAPEHSVVMLLLPDNQRRALPARRSIPSCGQDVVHTTALPDTSFQ